MPLEPSNHTSAANKSPITPRQIRILFQFRPALKFSPEPNALTELSRNCPSGFFLSIIRWPSSPTLKRSKGRGLGPLPFSLPVTVTVDSPQLNGGQQKQNPASAPNEICEGRRLGKGPLRWLWLKGKRVRVPASVNDYGDEYLAFNCVD